MAILVDACARAAMAQRRDRGREAAIDLRIAAVPHPGPGSDREVLWAGWATGKQAQQRRSHFVWAIDDAVLFVDPRIMRYAAEHDLTVSAWHLGPLSHLEIVDQRLVLLDLQAWERQHRSLQPAARAVPERLVGHA
jgi:hypothetical protein